jgi:hypothetical protein
LPIRHVFAIEGLDGLPDMALPLLVAFGVISAASILFFASRYKAASPKVRGHLIRAALGSATVAATIGLLVAAR